MSLSRRLHERSFHSSIFMLSAVAFFVNGSWAMANPLIAIYAHDFLGASAADVGIVVAVFFVASLVSKTLISLIGSSRRIIVILTVGVIGTMLTTILYALAVDPLTMMIIRIANGLSFAVYNVFIITSVSTLDVEQSGGTSLKHIAVGMATGLVFGPAIGSVAAALLGVRLTFVAAGLIVLPSIILCPTLRKKTSTKNIGLGEERSIGNLPILLRNKEFLTACTALLLQHYVFGVALAYVPIYAKMTFRIPDHIVPALFFCYYGATLTARLIAAKIKSRSGMILLTFFGLLSITTLLLLMAWSPSFLLFAISLALLGMPHGFIFPFTAIMVENSTDREARARANAFYLMCMDAGDLAGPMIASLLVYGYGIPFALTATSAIPLIGVVLVFLMRKRLLITRQRQLG